MTFLASPIFSFLHRSLLPLEQPTIYSLLLNLAVMGLVRMLRTAAMRVDRKFIRGVLLLDKTFGFKKVYSECRSRHPSGWPGWAVRRGCWCEGIASDALRTQS